MSEIKTLSQTATATNTQDFVQELEMDMYLFEKDTDTLSCAYFNAKQATVVNRRFQVGPMFEELSLAPMSVNALRNWFIFCIAHIHEGSNAGEEDSWKITLDEHHIVWIRRADQRRWVFPLARFQVHEVRKCIFDL